MTESANDNWIEEQEWEIKTMPIPQDIHQELLNESLKQYELIWKELSKK